jgi:hypothetical protein
MILIGLNGSSWRNTCPTATWSTTNPTWAGQESNTCLFVWRSMTDISLTVFCLTMTSGFISLYVSKGASQWSLCFRPHAVLQCSNSEIVGLNTAVRLGMFPRCFCVRVVGRSVELSRSFVQTLTQNTEQRCTVQEFNFQV